MSNTPDYMKPTRAEAEADERYLSGESNRNRFDDTWHREYIAWAKARQEEIYGPIPDDPWADILG